MASISLAGHDRLHPSAASPRGAHVATVAENRWLCTDHYRLILNVPRFRASVPGQFVQVDCRDGHGGDVAGGPADSVPREFEWPATCGGHGGMLDPDFAAPLAYLRRPFSIADRRDLPDGSTQIDIIHRVVGKGTSLLKQLRPGERVSLLGPLGVGFRLPEHVEMACLVGGGVGIPPMMYLATALEKSGVKSAVAFIGAQRRDLLPVTFRAGPDAMESDANGEPVMNVEEFRAYGCASVITTDDGSYGMKGYVTQALRRFLLGRQAALGTLNGTVVCCCGPTPMMKATAGVAAEFGVVCLVSLEQPMACGMATCQSCVIKYRPHGSAEGTDWKYRLTCTDGPVFDSRDILW